MMPTAKHLAATDRLAGVLTRALEDGQPVPCAGDPMWTSDDLADQEAAADLCTDCALLLRCRGHALSWPEPAGVYGGMTPADRTPKETS